ncbi:MAG: 4Fe-4S binding protein [Anaerolineae bacterium]|nr:4Fe-4S binding protein [Anaerolineae bacterium]
MFKQMFNMIIRGGGSEQNAPSLDRLLEGMDKHLENFDTLIQPAPESKPRTPFDAHLPKEQMSLANLKPRQRLRVIPKALPLIFNMQRAARMYDGKFRATRSEMTPEVLAEFEALARAAGVYDMKYVKVPRNAIFQGKGIPCEYAIVYTVEMDKAPISTSPSFESQLEVMRGYKNMAVIGTKLARFLHKHGFAAYPGTALGGLTDYVHLAELAGLGAIGYHGLLITPGQGARLRINTIYTNIRNLPITSTNEHEWVRDFCAMCRKCVRSCPVDAIYDQPQPRGDGGMQCIEHSTCRDYFTQHYGCAVCLAVCPFSQVGYDAVKARFKGNPTAPRFQIPTLP